MSHATFDPEVLLEDVLFALADGDRIGALRRLTDVVREGSPAETTSRVERLCGLLEAKPEAAHSIGGHTLALLSKLHAGPALIESGVTSPLGFGAELTKRLVARFLPDLDEPDDLRAVVREIFHRSDDHRRIADVSDEVWMRLLCALGINDGTVQELDPELATAAQTLAHHASSLGLQPEFTRRVPHLDDSISPFLELPERVVAYIRSYTNEIEGDEPALLQKALDTIGRCRAEVEHLRATKAKHGTSLRLTGLTFRLLQLLDRLSVVLRLTDRISASFQRSAVRLFREIVIAERTRNHVLPHIRSHADLLAFQVVEHAARKGGKYITSGRRDYRSFFLASMGGGAIVALFSALKLALKSLTLPLGAQALLYGLNYSVCFVLIYLTGSALATKQPAMTANTIAQALGNRQDRHLERLEALVVQVWRSQFVSFLGNLAMALPIAFLISALVFRSTGAMMASDESAVYMLEALHPWRSGTIVFAAIAGFFLFMAGLISAWVDNRMLYSHFSERVARHRSLVRLAGSGRAGRVAEFLNRNLGVITGNVFLGFALGSTGTVGEILGLPLDIRHIAFASAEFGTALEILDFRVAASLLWPVALGVVLIGLVNFVVSFGFSLATALESRRITWRETRVLAKHLVGTFLRRPLDWFFPPKEQTQG
jgi:site-specific recombinase